MIAMYTTTESIPEKKISRITKKVRRDDRLMVIREDGTFTVYAGDCDERDDQLIAYGKCLSEEDARLYFGQYVPDGLKYYVN